MFLAINICILIIIYTTIGDWKEGVSMGVGIVTGNPGVFQGYPYLYPRKPVPVPKGRGFDGLG